MEVLSHGDISISEGDPLQLHCLAKGNPSPLYDWTHPSRGPHFSQSSAFIINSTTTLDGGEYICSASNNMGTVTHRFLVNVQGRLTYLKTLKARANLFHRLFLKTVAYFLLSCF